MNQKTSGCLLTIFGIASLLYGLLYYLVGYLLDPWNVFEALIAIGAGIVAGSTSLIAFGVDSLIEVISAVGLLWRLLRTGPNAGAGEHETAERRALYIVSATFFLLAAYVGYESIIALVAREGPDRSTVGLVLSILSLVVMPVLAYMKQKTVVNLAVEHWKRMRLRRGFAPTCRLRYWLE